MFTGDPEKKVDKIVRRQRMAKAESLDEERRKKEEEDKAGRKRTAREMLELLRAEPPETSRTAQPHPDTGEGAKRRYPDTGDGR